MSDKKPSVEQRLQQLEDRVEIAGVIKRVAWAGDHNRREEWLDCFTEDARIDFKSTPRPGPAAPGAPPPMNIEGRGKASLAAFFDAVPRRADVYNKHFLADQLIHLGGDEARAETYIALILDVGGAPQLNSTGRYSDRLRRGADGKWRISERIGRIDTRVGG